MKVEMFGGPLDGAIINKPECTSNYLIVTSYGIRSVYKIACCNTCSHNRQTIPFHFIGYDKELLKSTNTHLAS